MTTTGKFLSDIQKLMKHDRQNNSGKSDYERFAADLKKLFQRTTSVPATLSGSVFEYWENEYIFNSPDRSAEPSEENALKLGAMLSFLEISREDEEYLSENDWKELSDAVNYEAEDLPIELLQDLMSLAVSHGAY